MSSTDFNSMNLPSPSLTVPNNGTLESRNSQKAQNLSQSFNDRESAMACLPERKYDNDAINPLKRRGADIGYDHPRRRVTMACETCRSRKSRCDGSKPKCRLCTELGAECIYREPGIKLDAGDKLILERLTRIEGLLQNNLIGQANNLALVSGSPVVSSSMAMSNDELNAQGHVNSMSMIPISSLGTWTSPATNILTMPKAQTNAAFHIFQWPIIKDLVSRPCDPQILLQLEMSREPLAFPKPQRMDLSNNSVYIRAFFSRVNVWYACVNPYDWPRHYQTAFSNGFREGPESCIVLLVLALGQASISGSISQIQVSSDPPGMSYFASAWTLLPALMTRNNVMSTQCMVLAAAYLFYLVRPLEAWTLLSSISTKLQLLLSSPGRVPTEDHELSERVYWNALFFESDLLAELDLPHSGIVQFEEWVGLPSGFLEFEQYDHMDDGDSSGESNGQFVGRDELWYLLADIALRKLLNRVSQFTYRKYNVNTMGAFDPVVAELDFQLGQWYENLPLPLQFPFTKGPLIDPVQTVLRLRFFACKTTIFRPYILAVLDNEQAALYPTVRESCRMCLDAAVRQLEHVTAHHASHMPYLWQGALSIVSQTLLVMGATMSPSLALLLPAPKEIDAIINGVVEEITRHSHLAPSLALCTDIIKEAEYRRQDILGMR